MALKFTLEVAKKEFMENVLSWRFAIALVLGTLILVTSVLALGASYQEDQDAYRAEQAGLERQEDTNPFSTTLLQTQRILEKPNVLSIFAGGPGEDLRRTDAGDGTGAGQASGMSVSSGSASPTNLRFDPLDLGFVAVVVMTFMAVIFAYDSVSGEKERGTLKLMLANPVPKDSILLGKYLGGMASILLPFVLSVVIGITVLQLKGVALVGEEWIRLGVILLLFVPLVSAFYLLGLLVSSIAKRSSVSLLALTLAWLVLVFGVGNVAAVVAKETSDTTNDAYIQEKFREIQEREFNAFEDISAELFQLFEKRGRQNNTLSAEDQARLEALQAQQREIADESQAEREAVLSAAYRQLDNQLNRAEAIASLSPAEAFRSLSTALARSDYWSYKDAAEAAQVYEREVERAREQWQQDNPNQGGPRNVVFIGGPGGGGGVRLGGVALSGDGFEPPEFHYRAASISEQVGTSAGVRDLLVLLGFNVVAFLGAYVAFLRYDVR